MAEDVYVELVLHGSEDQAIGFIEGLRLGTPEVESVWYCCRESVATGGFMETMMEKLANRLHVVLPRSLAEVVRDARAETEVLDLEVVAIEEIDYAELEFEYKCYSREVGDSVRAVIEQRLPDGVRIEGYKVEEDVDAEAEGVELYSPRHHYTVAGSGRYVGPVPGIFAIAHRLHEQDFIHPGKVRLHRAT